jgi:hypothetical protein
MMALFVYALDIHPLAINAVKKEIKKKRISNIKNDSL